MSRIISFLVVFLFFVSAMNSKPRAVLDPNTITEPGKIWIKGSTLFVNDRFRGVHIFNISTPLNPIRLSTIAISNNIDIAVYSNALYADSYGNLHVYDISMLTDPRLIRIIPDATGNYYGATGDFVDDSEFGCGVGFGCGSDSSPSGATSTGGSMARFSIVDNYLYSLKYTQMKVFSISNPTNPDAVGDANIGWDIETIFPVKDRNLLFLGGNEGIYVYSISNRANPVYLSRLTHARSYDPVVVQSNFAYVTLRDGSFIDGPSSRFEVINISDISNMFVTDIIGMDAPYGLAVSGAYSYVCDGYDGLEIFNVSDVSNVIKVVRLQGYNGYDVIVTDDTMILTGNDGVVLYDISNPTNPAFLNKL